MILLKQHAVSYCNKSSGLLDTRVKVLSLAMLSKYSDQVLCWKVRTPLHCMNLWEITLTHWQILLHNEVIAEEKLFFRRKLTEHQEMYKKCKGKPFLSNELFWGNKKKQWIIRLSSYNVLRYFKSLCKNHSQLYF